MVVVMNKKDIILMAQKAQFFVKDNEAYSPSNQEDFELTECLERFAGLVAAAEREECANLCKEMYLSGDMDTGLAEEAIRARGQT
jgi:hypothetical protein